MHVNSDNPSSSLKANIKWESPLSKSPCVVNTPEKMPLQVFSICVFAIGLQSEQGTSVALSADGNTAIIGGPGDGGPGENNVVGAAWVYTRSGSVWSQQGGKLVGTGAVGGSAQGQSVAISADGNTALVGGPRDDNEAGAVWFYTRLGSVWPNRAATRRRGCRWGSLGHRSGAICGRQYGHHRCAGHNNNAGTAWVFTKQPTRPAFP